MMRHAHKCPFIEKVPFMIAISHAEKNHSKIILNGFLECISVAPNEDFEKKKRVKRIPLAICSQELKK
jgi:hypothetical protein